MANAIPTFAAVLCVGVLILAWEGNAIRRQVQLQNLQPQPNLNVMGQNQVNDPLVPGLQSGFGQNDQNLNSLATFALNGLGQQPAPGSGAGGMEALMNILQQLLMQQQQQMTGLGGQQPTSMFDGTQGARAGGAGAGAGGYGQATGSNDPLMALLGSAAVATGPNVAPPPTGNLGDIGVTTGGLPMPPAVPNLGTQSLDQSNGNGSSGPVNPAGGNPPQPFQPSGKDGGSSNASSQFMGLLNGK